MTKTDKEKYDELLLLKDLNGIKIEIPDGGSIQAFTEGPIINSVGKQQHHHRIYITGAIGEQKYYVDIFDSIRNQTKYDTYHIYINSPGGDCATAVQFLTLFNETKQTIKTFGESEIQSAGSIILFGGHVVTISPFQYILIHLPSTGVDGNVVQLYDTSIFSKNYYLSIYKDLYQDFLTEDNYQQLINGRDIYLFGDELKKRMDKFYVKRKKLTLRHKTK